MEIEYLRYFRFATVINGSGAIYQAGGNMMLDRVTFEKNTSTWGGGLYQAGGAATLTENTKFIGNTANKNTGSALVKAKDATLTINNSLTNQQKILDSALNLYLNEIESLLPGV